MFVNENLLPVNIIDLAAKYAKTNDINEKYQLEMRIKDIVSFLSSFLKEHKEMRRT